MTRETRSLPEVSWLLTKRPQPVRHSRLTGFSFPNLARASAVADEARAVAVTFVTDAIIYNSYDSQRSRNVPNCRMGR